MYICDKGLVVDYFREVDPVHVKSFIDKWDLYNEGCNHYTKEQQEQIQREQPLHVRFHGHITLNGQKLRSDHGCGVCWLSDYCLPKESCESEEAEAAIRHYGLDQECAWAIHRQTYLWGESNGLDIQSLIVRMERRRESISGQHFTTPATGESISLTHPLTGAAYTLTVHEVEQRELPEHAFHDPAMEYPRHFLAVSYSLEPDISERGFMIQDCADGDTPRPKQRDPNEFEPAAFHGAAAIGMIGGAEIAVGTARKTRIK